MIVRIIAGTLGGRKIDAPDRSTTHAMSERARNAMFNSIGSDIKGVHVLDAFAGSGSVGIEALSRGAIHAVFVERDKIACKIIAKNVTSLDLEERSTLIRTAISKWLETGKPELFDIIFADPPYNDPQLSTVKKLFGLLKPGALMVLSHSGKGEVPVQDGIVVVDNRSYGNLHLTFFRRDT